MLKINAKQQNFNAALDLPRKRGAGAEGQMISLDDVARRRGSRAERHERALCSKTITMTTHSDNEIADESSRIAALFGPIRSAESRRGKERVNYGKW